MLKEERDLHRWALCEKGEPFFIHPALDRKGFYREITALVRAVRADERERCAKVAENHYVLHGKPYGVEIAAAIRGRK